MLTTSDILLAIGPGGEYVREFGPDDDGALVELEPALDEAEDVELAEDREAAVLERMGALSAAQRLLIDQTCVLNTLGRVAKAVRSSLIAASRVAMDEGVGTVQTLKRDGLGTRGALANDMKRAANEVRRDPVVVVSNGFQARAARPGDPRSYSMADPHEVGVLTACQPISVEALTHESDPETTEDSATHPGLPRSSWLFPDDAGTRRRDRREQGDGLRARRGADQKGRAHSRAQQGTLFVNR